MTTGSTIARFTITLSQAVSEQVAVEWHTADGTALAGVDYAAAKGTVLFAPGETSKVVDILVYGRAVGSEDRNFFLEMTPPPNAILGESIGECIIYLDTAGNTAVIQVIVPTGPQGAKGDSAYQSWLNLGNTGTEQDFIDSLKPSAEEIAAEVAPLLDVSNSPLTAEGTETLSKPDTMTGKRLARRVAYVGAAKVATVVLADGDNLITHAALSGDAVDFNSISLYPRILRGTVVISPEWSVEPGDKILIKSAVAGDVLHVCQYDVISERAVKNVVEPLVSTALVPVSAAVAKAGSQAFEALRRSYADMGYNVVGTFREGFTYVNANDVGIDEVTGKGFTGPAGQVNAGTDPASGGFVDRSGSLTTLICLEGGDLSAVIASAPASGAEVKIIGTVAVGSPILTDKNINFDCSDGEIIWNGTTGTCLRILRASRSNTTGLSVAATKGARSVAYVPPLVQLGDIVIMRSSDVRWANVDGDYLWGHPARVTKVGAGSIEFEPALTGTFTINGVEVVEPFRMDSNIKITATQDTDTSLLNIGWCVDSSFDTVLNGTGPQNVGFGVSGINVDINTSVRGFKHGYTTLGYGVSVSGHDIKVSGVGSDCRHVTDGTTRDFVSTNLHFNMDVTKASDAPLFLYVYGVHANAIGVKFRGKVSGAGNLLCDRTGGADIDVEFNEQTSSYTSGCVLINEMPPNGTKIRGKSGGGKCAYVLCNPDGAVGAHGIDISVESHGQKILFAQSLNKSYSKVEIHDCTGEAFQYHGNDWTGCDVDVSYTNNKLGTITPFTNNYFSDFAAANSVKVRSYRNKIDDSQVTGLFRFTGALGTIDFKSDGDENKQTFRFIEASGITASLVKNFDVKNVVAEGTLNLSLPTGATYTSMGRVVGCNLKPSSNPLSFSAWPCYVAENSFAHTASITLATTIKPGPGNYSKNGQNIVWNGTNQQWPQY